MQAMLRRAKDLTAARKDLVARLEAAMQAESEQSWKSTSDLVRLVCMARPGGPTRAELGQAVRSLLTSLTAGSGEDSYARQGLREHAAIVQLQLRRVCSYVISEMERCAWTTQPGERQAEDMALLKALFVLTDSAQWKSVAGMPAAAKICAHVVGSLVMPSAQISNRARCSATSAAVGPAPAGGLQSTAKQYTAQGGTVHAGGLFQSLRRVLHPSGEWQGVRGTAQAPLLWTLAIRPLTSGFPTGDPRQVWVAFTFAREILSIPAVATEMPQVLHRALLHQSVWPRLVFSLGTAAQIHAPGSKSACTSEWLEEDRVLDVMCNVVDFTQQAQYQHGLQLLYLSALQRLVESLPSSALSQPANAPKLKRLVPLHSADHVQWLLCGLGGEPAPEGAAAQACAGGGGGEADPAAAVGGGSCSRPSNMPSGWLCIGRRGRSATRPGSRSSPRGWRTFATCTV